MRTVAEVSLELSSDDLRGVAGVIFVAGAPEEFRLYGRQWHFGVIEISDLRLGAFRFTPDGNGSTPDGTKMVRFVFVLDGVAKVAADGLALRFCADSAAIVPNGLFPELTIIDDARLFTVAFPAHFVTGFSHLLPEQFGAISLTVLRVHPAVAFLRALTDAADHHPITAELAAHLIVKLVSGLLIADRGTNKPGSALTMAAIHDLIRDRYADPNFDGRALASLIKNAIPPSSLRPGRFATQSPADMLTEHRIVHALPRLRRDNPASLSVIAAGCGFRSVRDLDAAMHHHLGATATILRRQTR